MLDADKTEVGSEEIEMEMQAQGEDLDEQNQAGHPKKRNKARVPIFGTANKDNSFFINAGFILLILLGYFIGMIVISILYTKQMKLVTIEMNLLAQAEEYYSFA